MFFKQATCRGCREVKVPLVQAGNRRMCTPCYLTSVVHELKTDSYPFNLLKEGAKTAEVRRNDRPYKRGDLLMLFEWDSGEFTGNQLQRQISNVVHLGQYGCDDMVLLSFYDDGPYGK